MGQYIVSEGARKGSYRRMDLAADILGGLFAWGEIQAIAVPGHVSGQDGWLNRALRRGLISDEDAQACQKDMEAVLTARGMDLQATYEEIYADVRRAYETRLGARVMDEMAVRDALSDDLPDDDPVASVLRSGAADIDQSNGAGDMLKRAHRIGRAHV